MKTLKGLHEQLKDEGRYREISAEINGNGSVLPARYDPEHAAFVSAVVNSQSDAVYDVASGRDPYEQAVARGTVRGDDSGVEDVLKDIDDLQKRLDERPREIRTQAFVAGYSIVNEDRNKEILQVLDSFLDDDAWQEDTVRDDRYPVVDWEYVRDRATEDLSERRIDTLQSRYEKPVEQHLSLTLVPDGGLWTASGDYLSLRFNDYKPCAYSIEADYLADDAASAGISFDGVPDEYDVENAVQLRIVRIPTDREKPTSLTPRLFNELAEGMELTVQGRIRMNCP